MPRTRIDNIITDPRAIAFSDWVEKTGRKVGWVAAELGKSKAWISYILNGHAPVSDQLADDIERRFGIDMGRKHGNVVPHPMTFHDF